MMKSINFLTQKIVNIRRDGNAYYPDVTITHCTYISNYHNTHDKHVQRLNLNKFSLKMDFKPYFAMVT
jgi:hypothetical protein